MRAKDKYYAKLAHARGEGLARIFKPIEGEDGRLILVTRKELKCPITREAPVTPVLAADGHVYEKSVLVTWIEVSRQRQKEWDRLFNEQRRIQTELETERMDESQRRALCARLQVLQQELSQEARPTIKSPATNFTFDDDTLMNLTPVRQMLEAYLSSSSELCEQRKARASKFQLLTTFAEQAEGLVNKLESEKQTLLFEKQKLQAHNNSLKFRMQEVCEGRFRSLAYKYWRMRRAPNTWAP